jgi:hypothetical protein
LLHAEEALIDQDNALAPTPSAIRRFRTFAITLAVAIGAVFLARNRDAFARAARCFDQIDFQADLQVAAACGSPPAAALPKEVAEYVAKQVKNGTGIAKVVAAHAVESGMPIAIVTLPFLTVMKNVIRLGGFLELVLGSFVPNVAVGVKLHGQLAVSAFDFF